MQRRCSASEISYGLKVGKSVQVILVSHLTLTICRERICAKMKYCIAVGVLLCLPSRQKELIVACALLLLHHLNPNRNMPRRNVSVSDVRHITSQHPTTSAYAYRSQAIKQGSNT
jgi:hypothetical protein